jgi:hypothetical protein
VPTNTELWWIGLGIKVIRNALACPQQNGTVEGLQGICCRWAEPHLCDSVEALQKKVDETNHFQRNTFLVPRLKYKTRSEVYTGLATNSRVYDPSNFSMELVWAELATRVWRRKVYANGTFAFCGAVFYLGKKFAGTETTITLDPIEQVWMIRNIKGELLKTETKVVFSESEILAHVKMAPKQA